MDQVEIGWEPAREANRENWDERAALHVEAYGLDAFDDPAHLSDVVRTDAAALAPFLTDGVDGLDVCHLQCHIGTDTLSLARLGARVTGVDFSRPALDAAAALAGRLGLAATWVQTDVLDARAAVSGDFDLVYTSIGTITWLDDLDRWAAQIAGLLRTGGLFYIRDGHPVLYGLDETRDELVLRYPYFGDGSAQAWDEAGTYVGDGTVTHTRTYEWPHPISEVVNALIGAGLRILRMEEGRSLPWRFSPRMTEADGDYVWPEGERDLVPCTFTIIAKKD
ncbi:2-polyprenyl-3-methyl-5-hydroxy-6-metoxy-1,4-benzoquinol methylase [Microbacterium azadirachtae]|jgi:SAM-dependent methyltransferase|uniref:2-polyprenyl-3-methyl-5-hydroxy-6-metoxy-1,4-benzoquinol methylase n=1 Tax=Microbacterium azadirachtae TaxID=582680 RepID=A0A1I6HQN0_9MICO|nr:class I SAM-dependent methyltransferase [Microbacterium azadirachtae]SFR56801.1 2-polyprenyl-3-methyl-5-hydroxy-6-metoxy-1,4-benzoquinol methylase [Microbacterium azadirachtae]